MSFSGGKDSTVLVHIVKKKYPEISVWSYQDDFFYPNLRAYMDDLAEKYNWGKIEYVGVENAHEVLKKSGIKLTEKLRETNKNPVDAAWERFILEKEKKHKGVFMGLRVAESRGRRMNYCIRGELYSRKDGFMVCNPLSLWSGADVFAYLVSNDIPIFEIYFKTLFSEPEEIRLDSYYPGVFANRGYLVWLKYYYPELYRSLLEIDGEISSYV